MKLKNQTDMAFYIFKIHLAPGATVEIPDDLPDDKKAYLAARFEVVGEEESAAPESKPAPVKKAKAAPFASKATRKAASSRRWGSGGSSE